MKLGKILSVGLLYISKTKSLRGRISGGHKAFLWAWLDKYSDHRDVRIAMQPISYWENPALLLKLEAIILMSYRTSLQRPNSFREVNLMQPKLQEQLTSADAEVILGHLSERI